MEKSTPILILFLVFYFRLSVSSIALSSALSYLRLFPVPYIRYLFLHTLDLPLDPTTSPMHPVKHLTLMYIYWAKSSKISCQLGFLLSCIPTCHFSWQNQLMDKVIEVDLFSQKGLFVSKSMYLNCYSGRLQHVLTSEWTTYKFRLWCYVYTSNCLCILDTMYFSRGRYRKPSRQVKEHINW